MTMSRLWAAATLLLAVLCVGRAAPAQPCAELVGHWVAGQAGDGELVIALDIYTGEARLTPIGGSGRWSALPDRPPGRASEVLVAATASTGDGTCRLEAGDWQAVLVPQSAHHALFLSPRESEIGLALRTTPIPMALQGDWERAELTETGPVVRGLTVSDDQVVVFDGHGEPTSVPASGTRMADGAAAIVLQPEDRAAAAIRLTPVEGGFIAMEVGTDVFQVVYRPGEPPGWLDPGATPDSPLQGAATDAAPEPLRGRWLVGDGDSARQIGILELSGEGSRYRRLGPDLAWAMVWQAAAGPQPYRVRFDGPDDPHLGDVLLTGEGTGLMWRADDDRYRLLRRVEDVPVALLGEWRLEGPHGWLPESLWLGETRLERRTWGDHFSAVGAAGPEEGTRVALLAEDRSGLLLDLYPLGEVGYVSAEGLLLYRPDRRLDVAQVLAGGACPELAESVLARLVECGRRRCATSGPSCGLLDEIVPPLRCTADHRRDGGRRLEQSCATLWTSAVLAAF